MLDLQPEDPIFIGAQSHTRIVALLRRSARAEQRRAETGHWAYEATRHAALLRTLALELSADGTYGCETVCPALQPGFKIS